MQKSKGQSKIEVPRWSLGAWVFTRSKGPGWGVKVPRVLAFGLFPPLLLYQN